VNFEQINNSYKQHRKIKVIDTPRRKATVYSFGLYYIAMSLFIGAPIPFPSLLDVSSEQVAFVNFLSLLITLVGSIIGIGFYVERRNNLKFEAQNTKMDRIDKKIDDKSDWLYKEMREMEARICNNMNKQLAEMEKVTEYKVQRAKDIEDERLKRIDEQHREHERRLDRMDSTGGSSTGYNDSMGSNRRQQPPSPRKRRGGAQ
jgi:hypothetical protein